jgi:hypothetical protein
MRRALIAALLGLTAWAFLLASGGCVRPGGPKPQRGGSAAATLTGAAASNATTATLTQPENPAGESRQTIERKETREEAAPVVESRETEVTELDGRKTVTRENYSIPVVLTHTVEEKTGTTLGGTWKDTAREMAAKLDSFKGVQWFGCGLLAFALVCFHPVVRAIVGGGKIVPALAAGVGVVLIFGPVLVVGHERELLLGALALLGLVFLVVRLSHKEGQLDALKSSSSQ